MRDDVSYISNILFIRLALTILIFLLLSGFNLLNLSITYVFLAVNRVIDVLACTGRIKTSCIVSTHAVVIDTLNAALRGVL